MTPDPTEPTALIDIPVAGDPLSSAAADAAPTPEPAPGGGGGGNITNGDGTGSADTPDRPVAAPSAKRHRWVREAFFVLVFALVVAIVLRTYVVQTFYIPTGSMEPTLQVGDRILVNKLSYHLHGIHRGDIVVFNRPKAENCGGPAVNDLVKRVIGLPGETISEAGGFVEIDHKRLNESWLPPSHQGITGEGPAGNAANLSVPYKIPANDYYVMGDNRMDSCDSRFWGPVSGSLIVGKVEVRVWPLSSLRIF